MEVRLGTRATAGDADAAETVVLATGARPYVPTWAAGAPAGVETVDAWAAIAEPDAIAGPVLVADWGGGWEGLDAAEVLADQGLEVTLACGGAPGWTLHQYQRNSTSPASTSTASRSSTTRRF